MIRLDDALAGEDGREEATLVERAREDRAAFGALYDRYVERVYRYAWRRAGEPSDAEDLTAETFRRALEAMCRYEPRGSGFGGWLIGIAANVLRERGRALAGSVRSVPLDGVGAEWEPADDEPAALDGLIQREEAAALWGLVRALPLDLQRVLVLRYAWGQSYAEMAGRLGRSEAACKQLSYRALKRLREQVRKVDAG